MDNGDNQQQPAGEQVSSAAPDPSLRTDVGRLRRGARNKVPGRCPSRNGLTACAPKWSSRVCQGPSSCRRRWNPGNRFRFHRKRWWHCLRRPLVPSSAATTRHSVVRRPSGRPDNGRHRSAGWTSTGSWLSGPARIFRGVVPSLACP
jgi:hypothetical protein